jgi:hypothetical protein
MHQLCVLLAALAILAGSPLATTTPASAQEQTCTGVFMATSREFARGPAAKRIQRRVRQAGPGTWSAAVAAKCPRLDPSWQRATKRKTNCGYFSSSYRYSCALSGVPALKRR